MRIVCVFAHQDDEMRCLGTLLRSREDGHQIAFVCTTRGDKGLPFEPVIDTHSAARVREAEMSSVATALDAQYLCLDREDGFCSDDTQLRRDLVTALRRLRAELVFTHWTADYNADHVATARAVTDASLFTTIASIEPRTPALDRAPRIFHTNPGDGYGFEATHFVQLTATHHAAKLDLIRRHRSQMDVMRRLRGHDYADEMADEDRRQGARLMVGHAEAFRACLAERRIPWPSDLPGEIHEGAAR